MRGIKSQLKCVEKKKHASLKIVQGTAPMTLACFHRILVPIMHMGEESLSEGEVWLHMNARDHVMWEKNL